MNSPTLPEANGPESDPERLLNKHEVCALLGLKPPTLQSWRNRGVGPVYVAISKTCIRYRLGDVLDWIEARRHEGG